MAEGVKYYICALWILNRLLTLFPDIYFFKNWLPLKKEGKILNIIKDLYPSNSACARIGDHTSEPFRIDSGVLQGSKLGPILFIIYINDLLKQLEQSKLGVHIWNIIISALGFADDIVILSQSANDLQKLINICVEWSKANGMNFNADKCRVMILNGRKKNRATFTMDHIVIEIV